MYECSIPVFLRYLNNLSALLKKGTSYASEKEIEYSILVNARLYPNMLPLSRQVQIACDVTKGAAARLSGVEPPKHEDKETTFEELQDRIAKTKTFLESIDEADINGTEDKEILLQAGPKEIKFTGRIFLTTFALPNLLFHVSTAFNILRHNGVDIGKMDYLGGA
tara:strand:+ start:2504 stop:2998 length:495 start_codon:yes stop_codon:yes gene_type:complete